MHDHPHHSHGTTSKEEAIALLEYMLHHNEHHNDELHELSHLFEGEEYELLYKAVCAYDKANDALEEALKAIKG